MASKVLSEPITLGNSGFEYQIKDISSTKRQKKLACYIRDIKTKEPIKQFQGSGVFWSRRGDVSGGRVATCKILGYDDKYYYLQISSGTSVQWGQIQSDGAVLKSDRTVLTTIAFFPHYKDPVTAVPSKTPIIIKEPPNVPKVVTISQRPAPTPVPEQKDISWIQKIINWIVALLNR